MSDLLIVGIVAVVVIIVGLAAFLFGRSKGKKLIEAGKVIGNSEANDANREEDINKAKDQVEKNKEVIARSNEAIERARRAREEAAARINN